jgi:hypothetical protein
MTTLNIVQQRLHNQHLLGAPFARPEQMVQWFGAVQAQEYPDATWGIAQRMDNPTQAALDLAYADGSILRTHAMRPTWHFKEAQVRFRRTLRMRLQQSRVCGRLR